MSDPFLDAIDKSIENGDIPQRVTNREVLAALRIMDERMDTYNAACQANEVRIGLIERWQSYATGAIALATFLAGGGLLFTIVKLL